MSPNSFLSDLPPPSLNTSMSFPSAGLRPSCFRSGLSVGVFSCFLVSCGLLLPLFFLVLYRGYQLRRAQATFDPDLFLLHSMAMHLSELLGLTLLFCGGYNHVEAMLEGGACVWIVASVGQSQLHLLTCVERHLAVVRPATYRGLRSPRAVRLRKAAVAVVWSLSVGWLVLLYLTSRRFHAIVCVCASAVFLAVASCCGVFMLCALRQRGPGEGTRRRASWPKRRAFRTIVVVMAALQLRYCAGLLGSLTLWVEPLRAGDVCALLFLSFWAELPSALVLPLLFLRRAGKLRRKRKTAPGEENP